MYLEIMYGALVADMCPLGCSKELLTELYTSVPDTGIPDSAEIEVVWGELEQ
jgi:hypothetical protein